MFGPGTYTEDFEINKDGITLRSIADIEKTIIKGSIKVTANDVKVEGFSIKPSEKEEHNMEIGSVKAITIKNCNFDAGQKQNYFLTKNAIDIKSGGGDISVDNCTFKNGYYLAINGRTDNLIVENSTISDCHSGINLQAGNNLKIIDTDISVVVQAQDENTYCVRFANNTDVSKDMSITRGTIRVENEENIEEREGLHRAIIIRSKAEGDIIIEELCICGEVIDFSKKVKLGNIIDKNEFPEFEVEVKEYDEYNEIVKVN